MHLLTSLLDKTRAIPSPNAPWSTTSGRLRASVQMVVPCTVAQAAMELHCLDAVIDYSFDYA